MTSRMPTRTQRQPASTNWWPLGAGAAIYLFAFFSPWTVVVSLVLLAAVAYRLARRPAPAERTVLLVAAIVLVLTVAAFVITGLVAMTLQSTHSGVSTPL